jgi:hypothetical protein
VLFSCGCCDVFFLVLYDPNQTRDDHIKVTLNGNDLGTVTNGFTNCTPDPFSAYYGRYFAANSTITGLNPVSPIPASANFQATVVVDTSILIEGSNTVVFESVQNNGCNTNMVAICGLARPNGSAWSTIKDAPLDPGSSPPNGTPITITSGVGNSVTKTFDWPPA